MFLSYTHILVNEQAIDQDATHLGDEWVNFRRAETFTFWWFMTSSASPEVDISVDIALFPGGAWAGVGTKFDNFSPESEARTNYRTISLLEGGTTQDEWVPIDPTTYDTELLYPFSVLRPRIVEGNVGAVTTFSLLCCCNGGK